MEKLPRQKYTKEFRAQAIRKIKKYIRVFYNRQRQHSRLDNLSPAALAQRFYSVQQVGNAWVNVVTYWCPLTWA